MVNSPSAGRCLVNVIVLLTCASPFTMCVRFLLAGSVIFSVQVLPCYRSTSSAPTPSPGSYRPVRKAAAYSAPCRYTCGYFSGQRCWTRPGFAATEFGRSACLGTPWTGTAETVVLLSKGEVDSKKIRVEFSLEDMDMSEFQDGATYTQIKDYVLEHSGLKVSNLYISQIKRKCGIEVGKNYNLPKSEDSRQPQCPPEKEKAIREAFKYFGII